MHWLLGLEEKEVKLKRRTFGQNALNEKREGGVLQVLGRQFRSPLILALLIASLATFLIGNTLDGVFVLLAVTINVSLGFVQEFKAERSLQALRGVLSPKVEAYRDGKRILIMAEELVPGDIVFVSNEHIVGADGILLDADGLLVKESILTGESVSVIKKADLNLTNMGLTEVLLTSLRQNFSKYENQFKVFMGTEVEAGVGRMLVVRTGKETEIGNIAKLVRGVEDSTPLQKSISRLSIKLSLVIFVLALLMIVLGLWRQIELVDLIPASVAMAVAAIPEGLGLSFTVVLVVGMQRILKHKALVRQLTAAETLGNVDVICTDKTGTLTQGVMKVAGYVTNLMEKNVKSELLMIRLQAVLCNDMRDPLELSMNDWALVGLGGNRDDFERKYPRIGGEPFSSKKRYIATLHKLRTKNLLVVSGAPEVILNMCDMSAAVKKEWLLKFKSKAEEGLRLVGFAYKEQEYSVYKESQVRQLKWMGIIVFADPIRPGVGKALQKAIAAGIQIKVITGDYKETGLAIAKSLGIASDDSQVIEGVAIEEIGSKGLAKIIDKVVVFARTSPSQKLMIVEVLKKKGYRVAMTGDGVNDAPSLKKADIGIVVASATEVAKETADLVLLKNDFDAILFAVVEGRQVMKSMRGVMFYLLSHSFSMVFLVMTSVFLGLPLPMLAAQILFINLVVDGLPNIALILHQKEALVEDLNNKEKYELLDVRVWLLTTLGALLVGLMSIITHKIWLNVGDVTMARSMVFGTIGMASLMMLWPAMDIDKYEGIGGFIKSKWMVFGTIWGVVIMTMAFQFGPLRELLGLSAVAWGNWCWFIGAGLGSATLVQLTKLKSPRTFLW